MYIIILDNKKKLHKYVNSLSQSEIERSRFFIISDGGDISKKDLPKKADYTKMNLLIPPPDIIERFIVKGKNDKFRNEYFQYLTRPSCHACLNKLVKSCFIDERNVVVCFGDIEKEFNIPKCIKEMLEIYFPDIVFFTYKDWKEDPGEVINYTQENKSNIIDSILSDAYEVGKVLRDLDSCDDNFN